MYKVKVGMATCGISAGAKAAYEKLAELVQNDGGLAELGITGCIGMCYREPLVEVIPEGGTEHYLYGGVDPAAAQRIYDEHIKQGQVAEDLVVLKWKDGETVEGPEASFLAPQRRIVLRNCGVIDPEQIDGAGRSRAPRARCPASP